MKYFTGKELMGRKMCLRCGHLCIKTEDVSKKICECENPVLAPATLIHQMPMGEIKLLPKYKALLQC